MLGGADHVIEHDFAHAAYFWLTLSDVRRELSLANPLRTQQADVAEQLFG
jgi:hypothetical protein